MRFLESGYYPYRCQIFPRMRGAVQVFENVHQLLSHQTPARPQTAVIGLGPKILKDTSYGAANIHKTPSKRRNAFDADLSQRLIEVLEEEKPLDSSPFIKK